MKWLKKILTPNTLIPLLSILFALLIGSVIILITGNNPIEAYGYMLEGAFGSNYRIGEVLVKATPLIFTGLAIAFAYRSGVFSIGADGQLIFGATLSITLVSLCPNLSGPLQLILGLSAGALGGAVWGAIAGMLKSFRGVSEIISTMMMNYIAIYIASYLYSGHLRSPEGMQPRSILIPENAQLAGLFDGTRIHFGVLLAVIAALVVAYVLFRTAAGKRFRSVGINAEASNCLGINVKKYMVLSLAISGALAGLCGSVELFSIQPRLQGGFCSNFGFDGIAVALMGQLNPFGVIGAALFFAVLKVGASYMELMTNIPSSTITILQGTIILFMASGGAIVKYGHFFTTKKS